MIFISSVAFNKPIIKTLIDFSNKLKVSFELSANIAYEDEIDEKLIDFQNKFLIHNYFPRPHEDFVLNLASSNEYIKEKSIKFACENIFRCEKFGIPIYSIHSGFRFDPSPNQLGTTFNYKKLDDSNLSLDLFIESLSEVLKATSDIQVSVLIENNVLTQHNLKAFGENPLLCCDNKDYMKIFERVSDDRLGILADFGHLKVSSNTLNFNLESFYEIFKDKIYAHHLSNNNSLMDTNEPFNSHKEFERIRYIENSDYIVLEINNIGAEKIIEQKEQLQEYIEKNENGR